MKKTQKKLGNKGFSLVELIVVIAIMAVLVGVLAPTLIKNVEKSREAKDDQNLDTVRSAITTMLADEDYNTYLCGGSVTVVGESGAVNVTGATGKTLPNGKTDATTELTDTIGSTGCKLTANKNRTQTFTFSISDKGVITRTNKNTK